LSNPKRGKQESKAAEVSRRDFLKYAGTTVIGVGMAGCNSARLLSTKPILLEDRIAAYPASNGYLLVDTKKCQGCMTCMLACSLVHEGEENLSLARIQVMQNPFGGFPDDLTIEQCRQCVRPACLEACPTGALMIDTEHGNVRRVDVEKCIGCVSCVEACPYEPGRAIWDAEKKRAQKCDLCLNAPFWNEKGGPDGRQACVELCPVAAIKFTQEIPVQKGDSGYKVNLRGWGWKKLGYPIG
jgi:protein NrfC